MAVFDRNASSPDLLLSFTLSATGCPIGFVNAVVRKLVPLVPASLHTLLPGDRYLVGIDLVGFLFIAPT